jgi:hypothetical protein
MPQPPPGSWANLHDNGTYRQPAMHFPGDTVIAADAYAACMENVYAGTMARSFCAQAEGFGVPIAPERYERTKRMLAMSKRFDDWLDTAPDATTREERLNRFETVASAANPAGAAQDLIHDEPRLLTATALWHNAALSLAAAERDKINRLSASLGGLARGRAGATTLAQYRFMAYGEGQRAGTVWAEVICAGQPDVTPQTAQAFTKWMGEVAAVATLIDDGLDLGSDYRAGRIQFKPTLTGRLSLVLAGIAAFPAVASREALAARKAQPVRGLGYLLEVLPDKYRIPLLKR